MTCTSIPFLLNSFDLHSYGSASMERYTLRLLLMCLETGGVLEFVLPGGANYLLREKVNLEGLGIGGNYAHLNTYRLGESSSKGRTHYYLNLKEHYHIHSKQIFISLHKKWSFPLRISLVNVTKSVVNIYWRSGHIYWRNP